MVKRFELCSWWNMKSILTWVVSTFTYKLGCGGTSSRLRHDLRYVRPWDRLLICTEIPDTREIPSNRTALVEMSCD